MNKEQIQIKVKVENSELYIKGNPGQNLLEVLHENNISIPNLCLGNGTCGKCKVKVLSGKLPITETDRRILSDEELAQGIRLACKVKLETVQRTECEDGKYTEEAERVVVEIPKKIEDDIIVEAILDKKIHYNNVAHKNGKNAESNSLSQTSEIISGSQMKRAFLAIDIGTTTIAMVLVNPETGEICDTYTSLNHQRKYGADVISRITAANNGKAEELKQLIRQDLWDGICRLAKAGNKEKFNTQKKQNEAIKYSKKEEIKPIEITRIIIAGNTTMIHLLMGYSCQSLGKYPFVSEHLEKIECALKDCVSLIGNNIGKNRAASDTDNNTCKDRVALNTENSTCKDRAAPDADNNIGNDSVAAVNICDELFHVWTTILPGISAFVGGDIVAGILSCPGFETNDTCFFIDLGTNGEIVLGNKDKLLVTSTAAGPAFEGGNIICGTASVPGSIDKVKIQNQKAIIRTIKNEMPPVGICGTGLVSAIAQLRRNKLIDEQGNLRYPYSQNGFTLWTQDNGESIKLYQKDIREFQMAKSAVRAGIEILMLEYGCQAEEVRQVYLAGGFGTNLSADEVIATGILPEEFRNKIIPIGNGALCGAIQIGITEIKALEWMQEMILNEEKNAGEEFEKQIIQLSKIKNIKNRTKNISLAEHNSFSKLYMEYMEF